LRHLLNDPKWVASGPLQNIGVFDETVNCTTAKHT
jgi:hypothetical protein